MERGHEPVMLGEHVASIITFPDQVIYMLIIIYIYNAIFFIKRLVSAHGRASGHGFYGVLACLVFYLSV